MAIVLAIVAVVIVWRWCLSGSCEVKFAVCCIWLRSGMGSRAYLYWRIVSRTRFDRREGKCARQSEQWAPKWGGCWGRDISIVARAQSVVPAWIDKVVA